MWSVPCCLEECRTGTRLPSVSQNSRRWINQWSLWRTANATPDRRLPSQPQGVVAVWPVPVYTAWWQSHMCVWTTCLRLLPERPGGEPRPFESRLQRHNHYTTRPQFATRRWYIWHQYYATDESGDQLATRSLAHCQPSLKISCKSVRKFVRKVANRLTASQTDRQTDKQTTTIAYPPR